MNKNFLLTLLLCLCAVSCFSQFVNIPDANFRTVLKSKYPQCFNANEQLDTTCKAITEALYLRINNAQIENLEGIRYFDNLNVLECGGNLLTSFPILPASLSDLDCNSNQLNILPTFAHLTALYCNHNNLTSLGTLPNDMMYLECAYNQISSIQNLPANLVELECGNNLLISLPLLPSKLEKLECPSNQLSILPFLPSRLTHLNCSSNQLKCLPKLPNLINLYCIDNELTALPALPSSLVLLTCWQNPLQELGPLPSGLKRLYCAKTQLTSLPALPSGLNELECSYTNLSHLPTLPNSLTLLDCSSNPNLHCLPTLPASLLYLAILAEEIKCLPNQPSTLGVYNPITGRPIANHPVCSSAYDPDNCLSLTASADLLVNNESYSVYPNPVQDKITVQVLGSQSLCLYDALGHQALSQQVSGTASIDISHLQAGLYLMYVGTQSSQLVIER